MLFIEREADFHSFKLFLKLTQVLYNNTPMGIKYFWKYLASLNVVEKKLGSVDFKREFGDTDNTTPKRVPSGDGRIEIDQEMPSGDAALRQRQKADT
ncbi:hypothetical protein SeMB42_g07150 [Synchytrium endobioticum]|uniref:Uncharacterized protein n=1 Tax=Synchytrium endobioticum TaxID=286115 RepID=A0A507C8Z4_9FUNG|nr:hypothetical protein SeMB42_g07150 [Synchytrium endobioticum]